MRKIPYKKRRLFCFYATVICTIFVIALKAMDIAVNVRALLEVVCVLCIVRWWCLALSCKRD